MKGTLPQAMAVVVVVLLVIFLTKMANNTRITDNQGATFWLEKQKVVECTADEITLEDKRGSQTHLVKDDSWPFCTVFKKDEVLNFQLSRGEKTHFLKKQPADWWR
jgi:hypothetical protein